MPLPEVILAVTTAAFAVSSCVLSYKYFKEKHKSTFITKNQDQSFDLLNDAMKKAQDILSKAAMEQINVVDYSKQQSDKLEQAAETTLGQTSQKAEEMMMQQTSGLHDEFEKLKTDLQQAQADYINYLKGLQLTSEQTKQLAQEQMTRATNDQALQIKTQLNGFIEQLESELTNFLHKSEEQSVHSLELELKSARQMVDTYKQQQFVLIDENIIAILERTLSLVLSKKLTLKDHVDLIYESLEKAKVEKFIA
jgi:hypothetical protein